MKQVVLIAGLLVSAGLLMVGVTRLAPPFSVPPTPGAGVTPGVRGVVEWEIRDATAPYPALVVPLDAGVWFGFAGANLYLGWTEGDTAVTLYTPPPECAVQPQKACESVCPHGGCFTATVAYRWPDADPAHRMSLVRLPNDLPWNEGQPGTAVVLVPGPEGTWQWRLP